MPMHMCGLFLGLAMALAGGAGSPWRSLAPGLELGTFAASGFGPGAGAGRIAVLRIDPAQWDMEFAGLSQEKEGAVGRTAKRWGEGAQVRRRDQRRHVRRGLPGRTSGISGRGIMCTTAGSSRNTNRLPPSARRGRTMRPRFRIFDLDEPGRGDRIDPARLFARRAESQADQAAGAESLGASSRSVGARRRSAKTPGDAFFSYSPAPPFSMHDLNRELLAAGIGVVVAQHLEGGPEAQLYIRIGKEEIEMFGSFETDFEEDDDNNRAWPVPNVLGIKPRPAAR